MSKEKFRNILISFACDYDNNKWSNDDVYNKYSIVLSQMFNDLEAKLAKSENKLNQYPYKNDVIEKQYEEVKEGIKFRIENNVSNDWEQIYHCIDILCEKHKARIRDIENSICKVQQLEQQLAEKDEQLNNLEQMCSICNKDQENEQLKKEIEYLQKQCEINQDVIDLMRQNSEKDKISFAVEKLEKVKEFIAKRKEDYLYLKDEIKAISYNQYVDFVNEVEIFELKVDNQIKAIKGEK